MSKTYEDMKNTMMKTVVKMVEVEEAAGAEMLRRLKDQVIEAQSSALPNGVLRNDKEHIAANLHAIHARISGFEAAVNGVVAISEIMDVDLDQTDIKVL
jgi:hypothetical protein